MVNEGPVDPKRMKPSLEDLVGMIENAKTEREMSVDVEELDRVLAALNDQDNQLLDLIRQSTAEQMKFSDVISDIAGAMILMNTRVEGMNDRIKGVNALTGFLLIWSFVLTIMMVVMLVR